MSKPKLIQVPKCKTVKDAIELDNRLVYESVPRELHHEIRENPNVTDIEINGRWIPTPIVDQLRSYVERPEGAPKIIVYEDQPVRAVSSLFKRIPLGELWEEATARLGMPIEEKATNHAVIARFPAKVTHYTKQGEVSKQDYEINPVCAFAYNFAERSFWLGYMTGVFYCTNQIFLFGHGGSARVVHNLYHMANFSLRDSIEALLNGLKTIEEMIQASQKELLPDHAVPVLYWKGMQGTATYLEEVFKQPKPETLWDGIQNLTQVTTHKIENFNVAFDRSSVSGSLMVTGGRMHAHEFVRALGFYLRVQQETPDREFLKQLDLKPLKSYVVKLLGFQPTKLLPEGPKESPDPVQQVPQQARSAFDHPPGWNE